MTSGARRLIWTSAIRKGVQIREVLRGICVAELLAPSNDFWVVAPWISDIPLIHDPVGRFRFINPLGLETITLASLLEYLIDEGTRVTVVTRRDGSVEFTRQLRDKESSGGAGGVRIVRQPDLHAKGLLGDSYALTGSMNFTRNGVAANQELVHFHWRTGEVADLRDRFETEFGTWKEPRE